jgi:hypothetical protein
MGDQRSTSRQKELPEGGERIFQRNLGGGALRVGGETRSLLDECFVPRIISIYKVFFTDFAPGMAGFRLAAGVIRG